MLCAMSKRTIAVVFCILAAVAGFAAASPTLSGTFAFQGGQAKTEGHLRLTAVGGNPLKQHIDIWMCSPASQQPIRSYGTEMTKKLHVVIVSSDFSTFLHVHPVLGADGHFTLEQQFPAPGLYYLYADGEPNDGDHQVFRFNVQLSKNVSPARPVLAPTGKEVSVGPYTVDLSRARLHAGAMDTIEVQILKGDTPAHDLHPYLGVPAHAVFLNSQDLTYVHVHPMPLNAGSDAMNMAAMDMSKMTVDMPDTASSSPDMMLHVSVKEPGTYKLWLQFRGGSQLYIAPFVLVAN
jgi:hypothetical protein